MLLQQELDLALVREPAGSLVYEFANVTTKNMPQIYIGEYNSSTRTVGGTAQQRQEQEIRLLIQRQWHSRRHS